MFMNKSLTDSLKKKKNHSFNIVKKKFKTNVPLLLTVYEYI